MNIRNNWFRLKRYLVIDFTKQEEALIASGQDPANLKVSFDAVKGIAFTGNTKLYSISLPCTIQLLCKI